MSSVSGISPSFISSQTYGACKPTGREASQGDKDTGGSEELSEEEKKEVQKLKTRDKEVKAHEMAHIAAGAQYVRGGATFEYQTGPDGKKYAVGGEVGIDTSAIKNNPEATIRKMQVVRKAALAPAQPSGQDRAVAAKAAQIETNARMEMQKERKPTSGGNGKGVKAAPDNNGKPESFSTYSKTGKTNPASSVSATLDIFS